MRGGDPTTTDAFAFGAGGDCEADVAAADESDDDAGENMSMIDPRRFDSAKVVFGELFVLLVAAASPRQMGGGDMYWNAAFTFVVSVVGAPIVE